MTSRFVVITPCRNEEVFLDRLIASLENQSIRPTLWIVVDDGSTDRTPEILSAAAAQYPYIRVVTRADRGERHVGPGVVDAFLSGLENVDLQHFDYVCKLDSDLELPPKYFERLIERMERDKVLGCFSGKVYLQLDDGRLVLERMGDENAIGAAKFYRTECYLEIGGFVRALGWDAIDGHMCRLKGWIAGSVDDPDLRIIHHRLMGSSQKGIWTGRKRWGQSKWYMGSAPYFVFAVALYRLIERPFLVGGAGILIGYLGEMFRRAPRFEVPGFRRFLRRFEILVLLRGRATAISLFNTRTRKYASERGRLPGLLERLEIASRDR